MALRPVRFVGQREVARTWLAVVGLAVLIGFVGTVVLAATAGARRTSSALDRFRTEAASPDARVVLNDRREAERFEAELAAQPFVTASALTQSTPLFTDDSSEDAYLLAASRDPDYGTTIDRPRLSAGRLPEAADEAIITDVAARRRDVALGDDLTLGSFDQDTIDCAFETDCNELPTPGPPVTLRVVGIFRDIFSVQSSVQSSGQELRADGSFLEQWDGRIGVLAPDIQVRLADGGDGVDELEAFVEDRYPTGGDVQAIVVDAEEDQIATALDAVDAFRPALFAFALIAGLAGLVAVEQAVSRHVAAAAPPLEVTGALGMSRAQRATALALPVVLAALVGSIVAVVCAIALSPRFPIGATRPLEPDPGVRLDPLVLVGGGLALFVLVAGWGWLTAHRRTRPVTSSRPHRPAWIPRMVAQAGASPALTTGARLTFEGGDRRTTLPVRSALVGAVIGVAGLVGAAVIPVSVDAVLADSARWGSNFDRFGAVVGDPEEALQGIAEEDGVAATGIYDVGETRIDGQQVTGFSAEAVAGDVDFTVVRGRLPADETEVALGSITADALDVEVGDTVQGTLADGSDQVPLDVVGLAAFPLFGERRPGSGAAFTPEGLDRLAIEGTNANPVVRFDDDLTDHQEATLDDVLLHERSFGPKPPTVPLSLLNLDDAAAVWWALAGFFGLLTALALIHALASTLRVKRVEFAVLRSLGFDRGQVRRGVDWQAVAIGVVVGVGLGVPLGLVAGRIAWAFVIGDLGVLDQPSTPTLVIALLVPVALVATLVLAAPAAFAAVRRRPARALAAE